MIEKGKGYTIKGSSKYFLKKYGTHNPTILIEDRDEAVLGCSWASGKMSSNPTVIQYAMRAGFEGLPLGGNVYYGKIGGLGELVHESELEEA